VGDEAKAKRAEARAAAVREDEALILDALELSPTTTVRELAENTGISKSAVGRRIKKMIRDGRLERKLVDGNVEHYIIPPGVGVGLGVGRLSRARGDRPITRARRE
jgi:predicted HTH transcriptional regulator